jgi:hypothetical protein
MKNPDLSFYVILDANVWVAERLLRSSIGNALLLGLTSSRARLGLPEVIEMEVNRVVSSQATEHIETLRKSANFLRQISGQHGLHEIPTLEGIKDGLRLRWGELDGLLERHPFTLQLAKAALLRVIDKIPPSGQNNEQFRDCCLWEVAIGLAGDCPVHLVSKDSGFYQNRELSKGLADPLRREADRAGHELSVHPTIRDLLERVDRPVAIVDESTISAAIVMAAAPKARELAATYAALHRVEGEPQTQVKGYATPKPSLVAVSFDVRFPLRSVEPIAIERPWTGDEVRIGGTCSYDPITGNVSEIEIVDYTIWAGNQMSGTGLAGYIGWPTRTEYI